MIVDDEYFEHFHGTPRVALRALPANVAKSTGSACSPNLSKPAGVPATLQRADAPAWIAPASTATFSPVFPNADLS